MFSGVSYNEGDDCVLCHAIFIEIAVSVIVSIHFLFIANHFFSKKNNTINARVPDKAMNAEMSIITN